mgnify:CR=1 FL=1
MGLPLETTKDRPLNQGVINRDGQDRQDGKAGKLRLFSFCFCSFILIILYIPVSSGLGLKGFFDSDEQDLQD